MNWLPKPNMNMKSIRKIVAIMMSFAVFSCSDLDLNPLSEGSSENWFSNDVEINMSLNDLYKAAFWPVDLPDWTDDWINREVLTPITSATINGEWGTAARRWKRRDQAISIANTIIHALETKDNTITSEVKERYLAAVRFVRSSQDSQTLSLIGEVVFYAKMMPLEDAYS